MQNSTGHTVKRELSMPFRVGIYLIGMVTLCFGVVLNTKTGLGVAAISSIPYCFSKLTSLSLGTCNTILYLIFVAAQTVLLKKLKLKILLQFPVSFFSGWLIDLFNNRLVFESVSLPMSLALLFCAIILTAFGVTLTVGMDLAPNPADGMVNTLAQCVGWEFGRMKYTFDIGMACLTCVISLIFAHHLIGIGVGTVFSALLIGRVAGLFKKAVGAFIAMPGSGAAKAPAQTLEMESDDALTE